MEANKYKDVLKGYKTKLNDSEITDKVNEIIAKKYKENNNREVLKNIYSCIDLTSLNATDTKESIWKMTEKVNALEGEYSDVPNVAAICVYPNMAEVVREALTADVKIAAVSGGFPSSQTFPEVKIAETALAISSGAEEIDIVINLGLFFEENYQELAEEISEIKEVCRDASLKVILETGALKTAENIKTAAILAIYSGADFIKTSTGKGYEGVSLEATYVMCSAIKEYEAKNKNTKIGLKASGGIASIEDAVKIYTIAKEVLGEDHMNNSYFRIGTSRLADTLLDAIK